MIVLCTAIAAADSCGQGPTVRCLKLGPELFDGVSHQIISSRELKPGGLLGVRDSIESFLDNGDVGDVVTIEIVEMLEYDYERLPDL